MGSETLLTFVIASILIEITPAPNMAYLAAVSLARTVRRVLALLLALVAVWFAISPLQ